MSDRKKAIETLKENLCAMCAYGSQNMESCDIRSCDNRDAIKALEQEPTTKNDLGVDAISRKAVQTRLKEIINEMETIFADIREREVNDSVCGLCEYDCDHGLDGFANECPGFEKDDCFKLNEKYRAEWLDISNLPSVTPQEPKTGHWIKPTFDMVHNHVCGSCEFICSSCNKIAVDEYDYCPNCGARMVEPQESEVEDGNDNS